MISGPFQEIVYRHHVEPRVKLYVPREQQSTETYRRDQGYEYIVGCNAGENIDHYWNVGGDRELSDTWTGFTRFTILDEKPPDGYIWPGRRLTRKQTTSRRERLSVARNLERHFRGLEAKRKAKVG